MKICDLYLKKAHGLFVEKLRLISEGMTEEEAVKCLYAFCPNKLSYSYAKSIGIPEENIKFSDSGLIYESNVSWLNKFAESGYKFDKIILNPPCDRSYIQLDYINVGLDLLSDDGQMMLYTQASWLTPLRKNTKHSDKVNYIKERLKGHVKKVIIENPVQETKKRPDNPISTTIIDFSKDYDHIEFNCCGETKEVNSIYDCNLVGDFNIVRSIFDKCQNYGDLMENHLCKKSFNSDLYHISCTDFIGCEYVGCSGLEPYDNDSQWIKHKFGEFMRGYIYATYRNKTEVQESNSFTVEGTKENIDNWIHYIMNNKLPIFLNIALTNGRHNHSTKYVPWFADKHYSDEEIYSILNLTQEEINLIDSTLKKYDRNSAWFKQYRTGKPF